MASPHLTEDEIIRTLALALRCSEQPDLDRRSYRMTEYGMLAPGVSREDAERLDAKAYLTELRRREAFGLMHKEDMI